MNQVELLGEVRELIGNPDTREVSNKQLLTSYVLPSLEWLANELRYNIVEDDLSEQMTADEATVLLPDAFLSAIRVEYDGHRLEPTSVYAMDRLGTDWRNGTSGTPAQYAIQGRFLILQPAPDSTAITTDSILSLRYIASSSGISKAGTPGLSLLDQQLVRYDAALGYLAAHPSDTSAARMEAYTAQIARLLPLAKKRKQNPIEDYQPRIRPDTRSRQGGAR